MADLARLRLGGLPVHIRSWLAAGRLHEIPLGALLGSGMAVDWLRLFVLYSYSLPFDAAGRVPADFALHMLRSYLDADWYRVEGGVYGYIARMLERFSGDVHAGVQIDAVQRAGDGVQLHWNGSTSAAFDTVVFATPPDRFLALVSKPTREEIQYFSAWRENRAETVIHTDSTLYARYGIRQPSAFDFFETADGWGYNVWLNDLCGLGPDQPYYLAFRLDTLIDPAQVVHRQAHCTPGYTVEALRHRAAVIAANGSNHTWHAGAWLGDGLHEGAVSSAMQVADAFG